MKKIQLMLLVILIFPTYSIAAGIQVSPASLNLILEESSSISQTINVVNPTADVQIFEIFADNFTDSIKPNLSSFTLESGEKKSVEIAVNTKNLKLESGTILNTNISVVSKPLTSEKFTMGTGVKIPTTITIKEKTPRQTIPYLPEAISLILIILVSVLVLKQHKK